MVYETEKGYAYLKIEDSFAKAEDIGNGATDKHLPFNTFLKFSPPTVKFVDEFVTAFSSMGKSVIYNTKYESEETDNEALFRGIFFMLAGVWTNKTVQATWDGTADVITGDFTTTTHADTLSVNMHIHDSAVGADHIDKTFIGTVLTKYGWKIDEVGGLMKEFWSWQSANVRDDAQAPDIDDGLDDETFDRTGVDGGADNWDDELSDRHIIASDLTIEKNDAALSGVHIKTFTMTIEMPVEFLYAFGTLYAIDYVRKPRNFIFEADVIVTDETYLTEVLQLYSAKTVDTFKLSYDTDKYIQCTKTYIKEFSFDGIPEAGNPLEAKLIIEGGEAFAPSFSWTGDSLPDPSAHITHT